MQLSVIITTYNTKEWLEKVMWGYQSQTFKEFELVIADDGSTSDTKDLINTMRKHVFYPVQHVYQEDLGFRKCTILNKAIVASKTDYLVISDGDCIPRADFLQVHFTEKEKGYFLSGGYFKLPMHISRAITNDDILSQRCFEFRWLKKMGLKPSYKNLKLSTKGAIRNFLNMITPTTASWNGHNSSAWKQDILNVNGFDERMKYGSLDREMGERLINSGIKGKQIRYSAICLHLDHERTYKNERDMKHNAAIRKQTLRNKLTWTEYGIVKAKEEVVG
ncbi:MAG: glycosyltransferase family 2 protein [Chitinophagaceae bacterium]|nr:glycosyltransferase family 2 protein [Chitinophagaceae bacterium]